MILVRCTIKLLLNTFLPCFDLLSFRNLNKFWLFCFKITWGSLCQHFFAFFCHVVAYWTMSSHFGSISLGHSKRTCFQEDKNDEKWQLALVVDLLLSFGWHYHHSLCCFQFGDLPGKISFSPAIYNICSVLFCSGIFDFSPHFLIFPLTIYFNYHFTISPFYSTILSEAVMFCDGECVIYQIRILGEYKSFATVSLALVANVWWATMCIRCWQMMLCPFWPGIEEGWQETGGRGG